MTAQLIAFLLHVEAHGNCKAGPRLRNTSAFSELSE